MNKQGQQQFKVSIRLFWICILLNKRLKFMEQVLCKIWLFRLQSNYVEADMSRWSIRKKIARTVLVSVIKSNHTSCKLIIQSCSDRGATLRQSVHHVIVDKSSTDKMLIGEQWQLQSKLSQIEPVIKRMSVEQFQGYNRARPVVRVEEGVQISSFCG